MKIKAILFLVLVIFLVPYVSNAATEASNASLTITAGADKSDADFNFSLTECANSMCPDIRHYDLSTKKSYGTLGWGLIVAPEYNDNIDYVELDNAVDLGINNIQCTSDNTNEIFTYSSTGVSFTPIVGENISCIFGNPIVPKIPVLIVPGILSTEIKDGDETLWLDLGKTLASFTDSFMDPLAFNSDLQPSDSAVTAGDVIRSISVGPIKNDYIDGLMSEFEKQGYVENQDLFTFPYDWRYGVSGQFSDGTTNVDLLAQKIYDILDQTGSKQVDIVAHSMGGLIVKKYVQEYPNDHIIRKAVFVGVPNTGAPEAIKGLVQGDNFKNFFLSQSEMKKISANLPMAYDLAPSQQYYNVNGSFVKTIDEADITTEDLTAKNIIKNLDFGESESYLTADHNLNSQALSEAEDLHTSIDEYDLTSEGVDLYNISGCKAGTFGGIVEDRSKNIFGGQAITYNAPKIVPGDDIVPFGSADDLKIAPDHKYYALVSDHGKMPSEDGIRQQIVNIISKGDLSVAEPKFVTQDISQCHLSGKLISVLSSVSAQNPVAVDVTDQDGNKLYQIPDGTATQIPNVDYEAWGNYQYFYLPIDEGQVYKIILGGTVSAGNTGGGGGTFTVTSQNINNDQTTNTEVFDNLPAPQGTGDQLNLGGFDGGQTTITTGDGTVIPPSSTVDGDKSDDVLPPNTKATLTGSKDDDGSYDSSVVANFSATDPVVEGQESQTSGVFGINYNLDNSGYKTILGDSGSVTVSDEGKHAIAFFSTDNAGNNELEQAINFSIKDTTSPTLDAPVDIITTTSDSSGTVVNSNTGGATGGGGNTLMIADNTTTTKQIAVEVALPQQNPPPNVTETLPVTQTQKNPLSAEKIKLTTDENVRQPPPVVVPKNNKVNYFLASAGIINLLFHPKFGFAIAGLILILFCVIVLFVVKKPKH